MKPLTVAIIGAGHLGTSVIERCLAQQLNVIVTRRDQDACGLISAQYPGIHVTTDNALASQQASLIILATKQDSFMDVSSEIKDFCATKLVVSLGPTLTLQELKELFGERVVRLITPVDAKEDIVCYATSTACTEEDHLVVTAIFGNHVRAVPEKAMPAATTYTLFRGILNSLFEPLYNAGPKMHLSEELSREMVGNMLISAGREIKRGISANDRLSKASGGLNKKSFTLKLQADLAPARELLSSLFNTVCRGFKK